LADTETPLAGMRCLVLDDELLIALDIQQTLETAGATVVCAGNASAALKEIDSSAHFDFAVIDVMLKGTTANSFAIAAALVERQIPFVFLTGLRTQDMEHAVHFPHAPVVEKPYQTAQLLAAIARVLDGKART